MKFVGFLAGMSLLLFSTCTGPAKDASTHDDAWKMINEAKRTFSGNIDALCKGRATESARFNQQAYYRCTDSQFLAIESFYHGIFELTQKPDEHDPSFMEEVQKLCTDEGKRQGGIDFQLVDRCWGQQLEGKHAIEYLLRQHQENNSVYAVCKEGWEKDRKMIASCMSRQIEATY